MDPVMLALLNTKTKDIERDIDEKVSPDDYAGASEGGTVRVSEEFGIGIHEGALDGFIYVIPMTEIDIDNIWEANI